MRHFHKCPNYKVSMSMERKGLDGVIIAGYEVGGHPSADGVGTFVIARRCAADMKIPVIAAGGIADGHGPRGCARARRFRRCHGHPLRVRR